VNNSKLTIIGKSDATITMILDNLESCELFYDIEIINNLELEVVDKIDNPNFKIEIKKELQDSNTVCLGVYKPKIKESVFKNFGISKEKFLNIIHKNSSISSTVIIGKGVLINCLVSVAAHTKIGDFVSINRNCSVGHHTDLKDFVTLNPGVNIGGNVVIGESTIIGLGTSVFNGLTIGKNTVIGAGSVVTKDIPDDVVAWGNPCKIIRKNEA
jgi:sugar O-acyltransferase (sialic acid O-acetyltransferase NeuD family)